MTGPQRVPPGEALTGTRVLAILRGRGADHLDTVVDALVECGVRCLEITMNTPGALEAVRRATERHGSAAEVGVGTVRRADQVGPAAEAGARFVVTPGTDPRVAAEVHRHGLAYYPGAFTATEVLTAWDLGASAVKVFPAGLGGPCYIRELRAPLDDVALIPTGGVTVEQAADYLAAGALAVGMGGPLLGDALHGGSLAGLRERARTVLAALGGAP
ncbi:bifunctional 4-hydroxy-2-oxoglutarate aldolase/2-dehydro-3-deoxy-phosphogluconate aldolase [Gandjariella thermophila]|uniref:2-keto-3-deoxy-phosphogluconate aldolase n=1 Tax=Gandjariella thermophila TaxID=1931992 RepID=A0A4D4JHH2_9PSEU|nr:bifunctional 4-hydroxy-2-oxoglutarate aldolase/2-dehydro-3-deoxy-phosphogluconate aldolase [Gandjariella thermophila]GDY33353.1 2-keto-3-deoxy-phosphogluconate aldolase [Gandjariella thermophila]